MLETVNWKLNENRPLYTNYFKSPETVHDPPETNHDLSWNVHDFKPWMINELELKVGSWRSSRINYNLEFYVLKS